MRGFDLWAIERAKAVEVGGGLLKALKKDCVLMVWKPKAKNPFVHYRFRNNDERDKYLDKCIENAKAHKVYVQKNRDARKVTDEQMDNVKIGDIFHWSWGYDQTNCDFFQVTEKHGKMITLQKIGAEDANISTGSGMACYLKARKDVFLDRTPIKKMVRFNNGVPYVSMDFGWCDRWSGSPEYCSWYA